MMQMTPSYYRIMAGAKSVFAQEFLEGGFIAANWNIDQDLTRYGSHVFQSLYQIDQTIVTTNRYGIHLKMFHYTSANRLWALRY